ncbi:membrane protein insertase YidC [Litoribacter ruber]|uniref:membrane protein insertase YidC n=1 Tax=Litoribacter ruber TaxID=702568 RepID=UPI001BDADAD0|nr:membrane protein insertase YidC [Litoribacter ruber]MBT0810615.1 membrane protein insertase YidC [Litoribacter ruber]
MDRNQATGLILFAAVILVYSMFFAKGPELPEATETPAQTEVVDSNQPEQQSTTQAVPQPTDSLMQVQNQAQFGDFAALVSGTEESLVLENEVIRVTFSNKGGEIREVELKTFKTWDQRPLILVDEENFSLDYQVQTAKGPISLNNLYFAAETRQVSDAEAPGQELVFTAQTPSGTLSRTYFLPNESYVLNQHLDLSAGSTLLTDRNITINWEGQLKKHEADIEESRRKTYMNFFTADESYDYLSASSSSDAEQVRTPLKWVAFKQRFFTSGIIAGNQFQEGNLAQETPTDTMSVKNMSATLILNLDQNGSDISYFFGPNNYNLLRKITPGFHKNVEMGYWFVSWVNKYIIVNLFHFLERFFTNYGVIIILIVFIIKLFLFPLTYKSYVGMAKMRVIKPEIDELKEKYKDDPTKMQQEQMKMFGQLGVSPISGCLPMLLQMPFLFAMFFFFPNSIELRQESFLWAHDLSTYDSVINLPFTIPFYGSHVSLFTLLMTISQIVYTRFNNQLTAAQGPMKNLGYIMPIGFMFVLNSYPAALSFYYFVSNMVTFGQQYLIKAFVDDAKIREKVEESKKKNANKKKSKFQTRLEEAMKASEAQKKKK